MVSSRFCRELRPLIWNDHLCLPNDRLWDYPWRCLPRKVIKGEKCSVFAYIHYVAACFGNGLPPNTSFANESHNTSSLLIFIRLLSFGSFLILQSKIFWNTNQLKPLEKLYRGRNFKNHALKKLVPTQTKKAEPNDPAFSLLKFNIDLLFNFLLSYEE